MKGNFSGSLPLFCRVSCLIKVDHINNFGFFLFDLISCTTSAAEKLGLPSAPPYLSLISKSNLSNASFVAGVSFASGGAGIFDGTDALYVRSIITLFVSFISSRKDLLLVFSKSTN